MNKKVVFAICGLLLARSLEARQEIDPLTVEEAVTRALQNNEQARASALGVEKARWDRQHARSLLLPTLNLSGRMTRIDDQTFAERDFRRYFPPEMAEQFPQTAYQTSYYTALEVSAPLFNAALLNGVALARTGEERAALAERATREQLMFRVIGAYLDVLKGREVLILQREYLELSRLNYEKAERLYRADRYSRVEALRWKVEEQQQQSAVVGSESGLRSARSALARLIGADPGEQLEIAAELPVRLVQASEELAKLENAEIAARVRVEEEKLVEGNPGLGVARTNQEASRLAYRQAKTAYLPNLSLAYSHGWRENSTLALDDYSPKTLMVFLNVPLFNGFQNYTAARAAQYAYRQSQEEFAGQVQNTRLALADVASRLADLQKRRELAGTTVEFSEQNYQVVDQLMGQGRVSNIDFIDAKLRVQNARLNEVIARYDFTGAAVELFYLLGELAPLVE